MKLAYRQIEGFVKNPDPKARAILVYGPDDGLMRERAKMIGAQVVPDLSDPFNVAVLEADDLISDPARLADEAMAMSMMGGARLIRVCGADDKLAPVVKTYLQEPSAENLVLLEAGELGPRSALRLLCEKAKNAAALPCYVEDEGNVAGLIRQALHEDGRQIDTDALNWLAANIGGDRARARNEIDKLLLYMAHEKGRRITLDDAAAICGGGSAQGLDDLIFAVAGGQPGRALRLHEKLLREGVAIITILRSLQNHFRRLHLAKSLMEKGESAEGAMKALQPPVFFKYDRAFKGQLARWPAQRLRTTLQKLADLEAQTKTTGMKPDTLCAQAILSIGTHAPA